MAAAETAALLNAVVRSAVVSTAGTRASSPECCQGGGANSYPPFMMIGGCDFLRSRTRRSKALV
jgi:hypothetical protein